MANPGTMTPPPMVVVQQQQTQGNGRPRPIFVTIIGVLQVLYCVPFVFFGFVFIVGGAFLSQFMDNFPNWLAGLITGGAIVIGIFLLVFAALFILVGTGTLRGSGWAWTLTVVLSILFLVFGVIGLFNADAASIGGQLFWLALNGLIMWYYYTPPVKGFFGKAGHRALWQRQAAT